jgi:hypothetical protein
MLIKASSANLIKGLCPNLYSRGVICLQYADDTILLSASDPEYATNLGPNLFWTGFLDEN